jgi:superfamily II DNA or RNA helicase
VAVIQIASNNVVAKLVNADKEAKLIISTLLSYKVDGFEHMAKKGAVHKWNGRSTFFTFKTASFPAGFLHLVNKELRRRGYETQILRKKAPTPLGLENPKVDDFPRDSRYDYQSETMNRLIKMRSMIAQVATGGGKSRIAKLCTARIKRPTLFLTTRGVLMYQMKDAYEDAGFAVGVLGDGEWSPRKGVNVGMVQTLSARIELKDIETEMDRALEARHVAEAKRIDEARRLMAKKKTPFGEVQKKIELLRAQIRKGYPADQDFADAIVEKVREHNNRRQHVLKILELFELVILEEAHEVSGNSFYDVMNCCKNAAYRIALTATPFMKDDEEANMRLMAVTGPIGIRISEKQLIDEGILAKPYFKYVNTPMPSKVFKTTAWARAYKLGITENKARNEKIINEAVRAAKIGLPVMILVQRKDHGAILKKALNDLSVKTEFIYGEHNQTQRKKTLSDLKSGNVQVLIGSTILDVGVDVPAVGMVILAGGGKAEVALRQRIGRGLREKRGHWGFGARLSGNYCFIVDFEDKGNIHLMGHARSRRSIIEGTEGFAENILPAGADFDFSLLSKEAS